MADGIPSDDRTIDKDSDGDLSTQNAINDQISSWLMQSNGQNLIQPDLGHYTSDFDIFLTIWFRFDG